MTEKIDQIAEPKESDGSAESWRSFGQLEETSDFLAAKHREFPEEATELVVKDGVDRRKFLNILGATMAFAGATASCIRRPEEHIVPNQTIPENTLPGDAKHYSTVACIGQSVVGLTVTSTDGRPTKLDGNMNHPGTNPLSIHSNLGGSSPWMQGEILNVYDPDRGQACLKQGQKISRADAVKEVGDILSSLPDKSGKGMCLVYEEHFRLLSKLK